MRCWLPVFLVACSASPPKLGQMFSQVEIFTPDDVAVATDRVVEVIDGADDTLHIALPAGENEALSDAILDAWDRGVDVEVVTDIDQAGDAGVASLLNSDVPVTLADGEITYFDFNVNDDVSWTSSQTLMTHAFVIADRRRLINASSIGWLRSGPTVLMDVVSEEIVEDYLSEHNQVFGGADATSTTAFDGLAKSVADFRWLYHTQTDVQLEVWFGPQERLTKRVIDAVYGARASVYVLTNDFANEGLAHALQTKAADGFDVQVVVGPGFGSSSTILSRVLEDETPDLPKYRTSGVDSVPTIVLVDFEKARDNHRYRSRAMVLSHDLYSAARLHRNQEVINDQLIDGNLWVFNDYDTPSAELEALRAVWEDALATAEAF